MEDHIETHFVVFADNINQYNRFIKENKVKNPVFINKTGTAIVTFGLNLCGFIILGNPSLSSELYDAVNRRIQSRFVTNKQE